MKMISEIGSFQACDKEEEEEVYFIHAKLGLPPHAHRKTGRCKAQRAAT